MSTRYTVGPRGRIYSHHDSYLDAIDSKWGWLLFLVVVGGGGMLGAAALVYSTQALGLVIPKWPVVAGRVVSGLVTAFVAIRYWKVVLAGAAAMYTIGFLYVVYNIVMFVSGG